MCVSGAMTDSTSETPNSNIEDTQAGTEVHRVATSLERAVNSCLVPREIAQKTVALLPVLSKYFLEQQRRVLPDVPASRFGRAAMVAPAVRPMVLAKTIVGALHVLGNHQHDRKGLSSVIHACVTHAEGPVFLSVLEGDSRPDRASSWKFAARSLRWKLNQGPWSLTETTRIVRLLCSTMWGVVLGTDAIDDFLHRWPFVVATPSDSGSSVVGDVAFWEQFEQSAAIFRTLQHETHASRTLPSVGFRLLRAAEHHCKLPQMQWAIPSSYEAELVADVLAVAANPSATFGCTDINFVFSRDSVGSSGAPPGAPSPTPASSAGAHAVAGSKRADAFQADQLESTFIGIALEMARHIPRKTSNICKRDVAIALRTAANPLLGAATLRARGVWALQRVTSMEGTTAASLLAHPAAFALPPRIALTLSHFVCSSHWDLTTCAIPLLAHYFRKQRTADLLGSSASCALWAVSLLASVVNRILSAESKTGSKELVYAATVADLASIAVQFLEYLPKTPEGLGVGEQHGDCCAALCQALPALAEVARQRAERESDSETGRSHDVVQLHLEAAALRCHLRGFRSCKGSAGSSATEVVSSSGRALNAHAERTHFVGWGSPLDQLRAVWASDHNDDIVHTLLSIQPLCQQWGESLAWIVGELVTRERLSHTAAWIALQGFASAGEKLAPCGSATEDSEGGADQQQQQQQVQAVGTEGGDCVASPVNEIVMTNRLIGCLLSRGASAPFVSAEWFDVLFHRAKHYGALARPATCRHLIEALLRNDSWGPKLVSSIVDAYFASTIRDSASGDKQPSPHVAHTEREWYFFETLQTMVNKTDQQTKFHAVHAITEASFATLLAHREAHMSTPLFRRLLSAAVSCGTSASLRDTQRALVRALIGSPLKQLSVAHGSMKQAQPADRWRLREAVALLRATQRDIHIEAVAQFVLTTQIQLTTAAFACCTAAGAEAVSRGDTNQKSRNALSSVFHSILELSNLLVLQDVKWPMLSEIAATVLRGLEGHSEGESDLFLLLALSNPAKFASLLRKCEDDGEPIPAAFAQRFARACVAAWLATTAPPSSAEGGKTTTAVDERSSVPRSKTGVQKTLTHLSFCRAVPTETLLALLELFFEHQAGGNDPEQYAFALLRYCEARDDCCATFERRSTVIRLINRCAFAVAHTSQSTEMVATLLWVAGRTGAPASVEALDSLVACIVDRFDYGNGDEASNNPRVLKRLYAACALLGPELTDTLFRLEV